MAVTSYNAFQQCIHVLIACADPEGGPTFNFEVFFFCLVDKGRKDPDTTISRPSSARQQNTIKWRFAGRLIMARH